MDHYSVIHYVYQLFYSRVYGNSSYVFKPTERMEKMILKFLSMVDNKYKLETIGVNFIVSYFTFQFNYWDGLELNNYSKRIDLSFIIGEKAFDRWVNRNQNFDWTISESKFLKKNKISISQIKNFFKESDYNVVNKFEEIEKKRFFATDKGFLNCIEKTTLYNNKSGLCLSCNFKDDCKKLLSNNYPVLYKNRIKK